MHGKAEDALRTIFTYWKIALFISKTGKNCLQMQGLRVIDGCGHACIFQIGHEPAARSSILGQDRILEKTGTAPHFSCGEKGAVPGFSERRSPSVFPSPLSCRPRSQAVIFVGPNRCMIFSWQLQLVKEDLKQSSPSVCHRR